MRDELKKDPRFIENNKADLCASIQATIVEMLMSKLARAVEELRRNRPGNTLPDVAIAGGVSANSGLRKALEDARDNAGWNIFIPPIQYSTDNAAMIAVAGYFKFQKGEFGKQSDSPYARAGKK
jgi:N6-L-threonylcarbamoyladenine synthase